MGCRQILWNEPMPHAAVLRAMVSSRPSRLSTLKRMHKVSCATALFILVPLAGHPQSGRASDNELYAGFCAGALTQQLQDAPANPTPDTSIPESVRRRLEEQRPAILASLAERRQRFLSYLLSTGVFTDSRRMNDAFGVDVATQQGQSDFRSCSLTTKNCSRAILGEPNSPTPKGNHTDALIACNDSNPACSRGFPVPEAGQPAFLRPASGRPKWIWPAALYFLTSFKLAREGADRVASHAARSCNPPPPIHSPRPIRTTAVFARARCRLSSCRCSASAN